MAAEACRLFDVVRIARGEQRYWSREEEAVAIDSEAGYGKADPGWTFAMSERSMPPSPLSSRMPLRVIPCCSLPFNVLRPRLVILGSGPYGIYWVGPK